MCQSEPGVVTSRRRASWVATWPRGRVSDTPPTSLQEPSGALRVLGAGVLSWYAVLAEPGELIPGGRRGRGRLEALPLRLFPTAPPTSQREHVGGASRPAPRPCYTVLAELGVLIPGGRRGRGNSKHSRSGCFRPRPRRYSVSTSGALRVRPPTPHPDRRSAPADALARPPPSPHPSRTTPTRPHRATRDAAPATTASRCTDSSASAS